MRLWFEKTKLDPADVRDRAMSYAVQTAPLGECPTQILARAELYSDFILSLGSDRSAQSARAVIDRNQLAVDRL